MSHQTQILRLQSLTGAAPFGSERRLATSQPTNKHPPQQRFRRRGPRSQTAQIIRQARLKRRGAPTVATSGKSEVDATACTTEPKCISIISINIRSMLDKMAELEYHIEQKIQSLYFYRRHGWMHLWRHCRLFQDILKYRGVIATIHQDTEVSRFWHARIYQILYS